MRRYPGAPIFVLSALVAVTTSAPSSAFAQRRPSRPPAAPSQSGAPQEKQAAAEGKFNAGQDLHAAGKLEDALRLYDESLALDDSNYAAHYQRGVALLALKRPADAVVALQRCVALQSDFPRAYARLGEAALALQNFPDAEKAFAKCLELDATQLAARIGAAQAQLARNAPQDARATLEGALRLSPPPADAFFYALLGETHRLLNRPADARANFTESLNRDERNSLARRGRGELLLAERKFAEAVADLRIAYAAAPDLDLALALIAAYQGDNRAADALELAAQVVASHENEPRAQAAYAQLLQFANRDAEAAEYYAKLTKSDPKNARWWLGLGETIETTDPTQAAVAYQRAAELAPDSPEAQAGVATALLRDMKFAEAAARYERLLAQNSENYPVRAGLATALFKLDRHAEAAQHFVWMQARRPNVAATYFFLGVCFDKIGDFPQALRAYEAFLQYVSPARNQLEIDKIKLRLPSLKRQVEQTKSKRHGALRSAQGHTASAGGDATEFFRL
jgi:tetratricopeptide (TPR) repeat protein